MVLEGGRMRRREFLSLLGGLSTTILTGPARGGEAPKRVALVSAAAPIAQMHEGSTSVPLTTFFEELRRLGYIEGKNLIVLRFTSGGQGERIPETAREVVAARPDLIFAFSSRMVQQLTNDLHSYRRLHFRPDLIWNC